MIQKAIERLEEEGGSAKASTSSYIGSTYRNLPWAHSHLLPLYLSQLTETTSNDDGGDDTFLAAPSMTRLRKEPKKEPSRRPQSPNEDDRIELRNMGPKRKKLLKWYFGFEEIENLAVDGAIGMVEVVCYDGEDAERDLRLPWQRRRSSSSRTGFLRPPRIT
ncbi:hypothetical protein NE237_020392 [Protea cynaroides]|uniref:Uncharacterized protein n=1 Tax=Protea cynaroides TaxID=273540 RepID=A0A9Q0K2J3_9MAGN|nr:hypothetical protein NE237_020392 [Protea cynaroides]